MTPANILILQPSSLKAETTAVQRMADLTRTGHLGHCLETQPAQTLSCRRPLDIDHSQAELRFFFGPSPQNFNLNYSFPPAYLAALPHSRLVGQGYILITLTNRVLAESYSGEQALHHSGHFLKRQLTLDLPDGRREVPFVLFREQASPHLIEQPCLLPTHYWHFNYHHWLIDCLPRLRPALERPELAGCAIIVPRSLKPFQQESLALLSLSPERLLPFDGGDWRIQQLYFPSIGVFAPHEVAWLREKCLAGVRVPAETTATGLYYISRADATTRRLVNEAEIAAYLKQQGFEIVTLSGISFQQQVELFAAARLVIGPHGSGLTNMIFAPTAATLIELTPDDQVNHCFWLLTNVVGQRYTFLAGQTVSEQRDFRVPLKRLQQIITPLLL